MRDESYLMPDGTYTDNINVQAKAWDEIATTIGTALGARVIGFVPNFIFEGGNTLSRYAAVRLYNILKGN